MKRISASLAMVLIVSSVVWVVAQSRPPFKRLTGPQTKNPGAWPYADAYDAPVAAGDIHHVRYEDDHIRLIEVAYFPGLHGNMHGHPWPSVFARDSVSPKIENVTLDGASGNLVTGGRAAPPQGLQYPTCDAALPQAPHAVTNNDTFPLHFYRVEYKRIDGDDIKTKWKTWYPWILRPLKAIANLDPRDPKLGPPVSKEYPYPAATESYKAAPNNHIVRYEDDHIVFLEVTIRPGETENLHGHAYPSVFMNDAPEPRPASTPPQQGAVPVPGIGKPTAGGDWKLEPNGVNGQGAGTGAPPPGAQWPRCRTMGPQWPHTTTSIGDYPWHFYRLQFKRIDGEGIKTHWREWYPWMAKLADENKAHPKPVNY